jgi:GTP-binding protein
MDIPGLIEGASLGAGLGHKFLRHVERTRVLIHLVDLFPPEGDRDPSTAAKTIIEELERYSPILAQKPRVLVFNKADIDPDAAEDMAREVAASLGVREWILVSAATGMNLEAVLERCWELLKGAGA